MVAAVGCGAGALDHACGSQRVVVERRALDDARKLPIQPSRPCVLTSVGSIYIAVCASIE